MANKTSFFPTGVNCKIKVNGVTLAYATNFAYSVHIQHIKPRNLGSYEADSFEPVSYDVSGSFRVIKYIEGVKAKIQGSAPNGASNLGNGVGSWTRRSSAIDSLNAATSQGRIATDGSADQSLNPAALSTGMTFDIEIYQKVGNDVSGVARFRSCRITGMQSVVDKRSPMMQEYTFIAKYLDEDTFIADASGIAGEV